MTMPTGFPDDYDPTRFHRLLAAGTTPELSFRPGMAFAPWRERLLTALPGLLGVDLAPSVPLAPETLWTHDFTHGRVTKLRFMVEAGMATPAYVCLPHGVAPPYAWVICLQGHSTGMHNAIGVARDDEFREVDPGNDRDTAIACLRRGVAALCLEQRGFGERIDPLVEGNGCDMCRGVALQALALGHTLLGERVHDVARAVDYLKTRADVDWRALGVTGNSAGGTTAMFAHALLPELAFAMPSCCFYPFRASMVDRTRRCLCGYVPGILRVAAVHDILGLAAPKPTVILAGAEDFPLAEVKNAFARLQAIYAAAGAPEACRLVVGNGGHRYFAEAGWQTLTPFLGR
jgi:dienelactone hydrolase